MRKTILIVLMILCCFSTAAWAENRVAAGTRGANQGKIGWECYTLEAIERLNASTLRLFFVEVEFLVELTDFIFKSNATSALLGSQNICLFFDAQDVVIASGVIPN